MNDTLYVGYSEEGMNDTLNVGYSEDLSCSMICRHWKKNPCVVSTGLLLEINLTVADLQSFTLVLF